MIASEDFRIDTGEGKKLLRKSTKEKKEEGTCTPGKAKKKMRLQTSTRIRGKREKKSEGEGANILKKRKPLLVEAQKKRRSRFAKNPAWGETMEYPAAKKMGPLKKSHFVALGKIHVPIRRKEGSTVLYGGISVKKGRFLQIKARGQHQVGKRVRQGLVTWEKVYEKKTTTRPSGKIRPPGSEKGDVCPTRRRRTEGGGDLA